MKRIYILAVLLVATLALGHQASAQHTTFTMVAKKNGQVITIDGDNTAKLMAAKANDAQAGLQKFIFRELSDGSVVVASMANPEQCLVRSGGSSITLGTPGSTIPDTYKWNLNVTGVNGSQLLLVLANPSNSTQALRFESNGSISLQTISNLADHQMTINTESNTF